MRIILIEDESALQDLYKREFVSHGFNLEGFSTGKEGLAALAQNSYDLLLLDIMLPDIDGLEILKQIKQTEKTKDLPVILLTNVGQDQIIKQGFSLGADGYLIKAYYSTSEIVQQVKKVIQEKYPELLGNQAQNQ